MNEHYLSDSDRNLQQFFLSFGFFSCSLYISHICVCIYIFPASRAESRAVVAGQAEHRTWYSACPLARPRGDAPPLSDRLAAPGRCLRTAEVRLHCKAKQTACKKFPPPLPTPSTPPPSLTLRLQATRNSCSKRQNASGAAPLPLPPPTVDLLCCWGLNLVRTRSARHVLC